MLKPHHQQYYSYFNDKKKHRDNYISFKVALMKICNSKCSCNEYHYFFKQLKNSLGLDSSKGSRDYIDEYLRITYRPIDEFDISTPNTTKHPWRAYGGFDKSKTK